jgi:nucleotide-binding universal stress UspA family protein
MFKQILLPLDGSALAETALPAAVTFAKIFSAPVTLLHVIEQEAEGEIHHDRHLTETGEANSYLKQVAMRFPRPAETHVHSAPVADVAKSIVQHASGEFNPDLIILTAHGKGGLRNLVFGSIAQQVAASGQTPVLLIKPDQPESFQLRRILVPLDNESIHDAILPTAMELARLGKAQIDLLCVIPTRGTDSGAHAAAGSFLPMTASAYLDIAEELAQEHFQEHLNDFNREGIAATAEVARGDPAQVIVKTAERLSTDVILIGTHGRIGMDAFWNRSVTAAVARRTNVPLLLIPLKNSVP